MTHNWCVCAHARARCCPQQADTSGQRLTLDDFLYDWPQFLRWGLSLNLDLRVHSTRLSGKPLCASDHQHWVRDVDGDRDLELRSSCLHFMSSSVSPSSSRFGVFLFTHQQPRPSSVWLWPSAAERMKLILQALTLLRPLKVRAGVYHLLL